MVESWVADRHVDQHSGTYTKDPDTPIQIRSVGKGKQWVGMASVAFANSTSCLRVEFIKYLGDKSGNYSENATYYIFEHYADEFRLFDEMVL